MSEKAMDVSGTPLGKILGEDAKSVKEIIVNFQDWHCTSCGGRSFNVLYEPWRFVCRKCGNVMSPEELRGTSDESP